MTAIIDTNHDVTAQLAALKAAGITTIGRYLNRIDPAEEKVIKPAEAQAIAAAGLRLFLIFEIGGTPSGSAQGNLDGAWTASYVPTVGAPAGAAVYYAVDFDAQTADMPGILAAFQTFATAVVAAGYRVGVYGSGDVCTAVTGAGYATLPMLSCSDRWSGSGAYEASKAWVLLQHKPQTICGIDCDPNDSNGDFGAFVPFAGQLVGAQPSSSPGWMAWLKQKLGLSAS
jgi:hypothetical protein